MVDSLAFSAIVDYAVFGVQLQVGNIKFPRNKLFPWIYNFYRKETQKLQTTCHSTCLIKLLNMYNPKHLWNHRTAFANNPEEAILLQINILLPLLYHVSYNLSWISVLAFKWPSPSLGVLVLYTNQYWFSVWFTLAQLSKTVCSQKLIRTYSFIHILRILCCLLWQSLTWDWYYIMLIYSVMIMINAVIEIFWFENTNKNRDFSFKLNSSLKKHSNKFPRLNWSTCQFAIYSFNDTQESPP